MIVDTSALMAVLLEEEGHERLRLALVSEPGWLPAPALTEFYTVAAGRSPHFRVLAVDLVGFLIGCGLIVLAYDEAHAAFARVARDEFGKGNGRGGTLNLLDLMVYAVARERDMAILCTGEDFAATDARIHPQSRSW